MRVVDRLDAEDGETNLLLKPIDRDDAENDSDVLDGETEELRLRALPGEESGQELSGLGRHLGVYSTTLLM